MKYANEGEQVKVSTDTLHDIVKSHSSWGMVGISRRQGSPSPLFGTSIKHGTTMTLTIHLCEKHRGLNRDWFHAKERLIEIELSASQFAELITTMNIGDGVPCTIRHTEKGAIQYADEENKIEQHSKEFNSSMAKIANDFNKTVEEATDILENKPNISKADRGKILEGLRKLLQDVRTNIPFFKRQFDEQMDKTIVEAKAEVEAFVMNAVTTTGLQAIKDGKPVVLELKENNIINVESEK